MQYSAGGSESDRPGQVAREKVVVKQPGSFHFLFRKNTSPAGGTRRVVQYEDIVRDREYFQGVYDRLINSDIHEEITKVYAKLKSKIIHDVFVPRDERHCMEIVEVLHDRSQICNFFAIAFHSGANTRPQDFNDATQRIT